MTAGASRMHPHLSRGLTPFDACGADGKSSRACLTQVAGTSGFSPARRLALRPSPVRPCFVPITSVGLRPSELFPRAGAVRLSTPNTLLPLRTVRMRPRGPSTQLARSKHCAAVHHDDRGNHARAGSYGDILVRTHRNADHDNSLRAHRRATALDSVTHSPYAGFRVLLPS